MKEAYYFGYWMQPGHFLKDSLGLSVYHPKENIKGFPWSAELLDTGLLRNGKVPDIINGKVYSTCGGDPLWIAFYWWDRSGDKRHNSNSGFYVKGFTWEEKQEAFNYACNVFQDIVKRQAVPLILTERE